MRQRERWKWRLGSRGETERREPTACRRGLTAESLPPPTGSNRGRKPVAASLATKPPRQPPAARGEILRVQGKKKKKRTTASATVAATSAVAADCGYVMRTPATWDNDIDGAAWGEVTCHQFQQSQQPLLRQRCQRCVHVVFLLSLVRLIRHFFSLSLSAAIMFASMAGFHWLAMTFSSLGESRWPFFVVLSFAPCGHWRLLSPRKRPGRVLTLRRKEGGWKKKTFRGLLLTRTARRLSAVCIDLKRPTGKLARCRQQHTGGSGCGHCGQTVCVHFSYLST